MGTGPFRPARTQAGDGSGAYDIPPLPDGSYNGPGSATYAWIQQNYTPDVWNSIPPDSKPIILQHAVEQANPLAKPGVLDPRYPWVNPGHYANATRDTSKIGSFLEGITSGAIQNDLSGLFGASPPPPKSTMAPIAQYSADSPPTWQVLHSDQSPLTTSVPLANQTVLPTSLIQRFLNGRQ